jgi:hypothetical protein
LRAGYDPKVIRKSLTGIREPAEPLSAYPRDQENRLTKIQRLNGSLNTMSYHPTDGLRNQLRDGEGNKQIIWDRQGTSGYGDLQQERLP